MIGSNNEIFGYPSIEVTQALREVPSGSGPDNLPTRLWATANADFLGGRSNNKLSTDPYQSHRDTES